MARYEIVKCCRKNGKPRRYFFGIKTGRVGIVKMTSENGDIGFFSMDFEELPLIVKDKVRYCGNCGTELNMTLKCDPLIITK